MAVPWIRRLGPLAIIGAVALVASGCMTFTGSKEVTGGESDGPFVVRIACEGTDPTTDELTFDGPGTESSMEFELPIDFEDLTAATTCTITEIESAGATGVTYECGAIAIDPEDSGDVTCTEGPDGLTIDAVFENEGDATVSFTVINDFTPLPTPTTAPPAAEPAPAAGGEARFTG